MFQGEDNVPAYLSGMNAEESEDSIVEIDEVQQFKQSVTELHNGGENEATLKGYKGSVLKLMGLKLL
jgi:hypothetical protein